MSSPTTINSPLNGEQPLFARIGYDDIRTLEGKLLTLVDAAIADPRQNKAFKDLVRQTIWWHWIPYLDGVDNQSIGIPID